MQQTAPTGMMKVAETYSEEMFASLSQTLSNKQAASETTKLGK